MFGNCVKGGLISERFSLRLKSPKHGAKSLSWVLLSIFKRENTQNKDLALCFGDWTQSKKSFWNWFEKYFFRSFLHKMKFVLENRAYWEHLIFCHFCHHYNLRIFWLDPTALLNHDIRDQSTLPRLSEISEKNWST